MKSKGSTRALSLLLTIGMLLSCLGGVAWAVGGTLTVTPVSNILTTNESTSVAATGLTPDTSKNVTSTAWEWGSNKSDVVRVAGSSDSATITAQLTTGMATVTATATITYDDDTEDIFTGTCSIEVKAPIVPATGIIIQDKPNSLKVPNEISLKTTVAPTGTTDTVVWSVSPSGYVTVDQNGLLKAVKAGTNITVTATCGLVSDSFVLNVTEDASTTVTGITLSETAPSITLAQGKTITTTLTPSGATGTVEWSSRDTSIATVNNGTITGVKPGTCKIVATVKDAVPVVSAEATVSVNGIKLNQTSLTMRQGDSPVTLTYTAYNGGNTPTITWKSSNTNVASVNNGVVTPGTLVGSTQITAQVGSYPVATCYVEVKTNTVNDITGTATVGRPFRFSTILSELNERCRDATSGQGLESISSIMLTSGTGAGGIYRGYVAENDQGQGVGNESYAYNLIGNLSYVPKSTFTGTAVITYSGKSTGGKTFTGTIRVSVTGVRDVTYSTSARVPVTFSGEDFNTVCYNRNGVNLTSVQFTLPDSSKGTLYYNYRGNSVYDSQVTSRTAYNRTGTPAIGGVTFVPNATYTGTVYIPYTATYSAGSTYSGSITITVAGGSGGDISYSVNAGGSVNLNASDFNTLCRSVTRETLDYVNFTLPDSGKGNLYYNYRSSGSYDHAVTSSRSYSYNGSSSSNLDNIYFVARSSASSTVNFGFTGYSVNGTRFQGTVVVTIKGGADGDLTYSTAKNTAVTFDADDFNAACRDYKGLNLNYVRFTLPSSSKGTLYYNYRSSSNTGTEVSSSTNYYYSSQTPYLENVSFLPDSGYTGTVNIDFRGWDTSGNAFDGVVTVKVGTSSSGDISYTVAKNGTVTFKTADFNDYCKDENGYNLEYVQFTLPASSKGVLYHNYRSSSSTGTKTTSSTKYYRTSQSPYVSDVTFVAANNYTGAVDIDFTGRDTDDNRVTGTVSIQVGSGGVNKTNISYTTAKNSSIRFKVDDFNQASRNFDDYNLDYVTFSLPNSNRGTLYLNYSSSSNSGTKVSTGTKYYRNSSPNIDNITFVPYNNYTGTVEIDYVGYDSDDSRFTGTVTIYVGTSNSYTGVVPYKTTLGRPVTFDNDAFNAVSKAFDDNNFDYVRFTLPAASVGTLYYDYRAGSNVSNPVRANTSYFRGSSPYLYSITFVPATGFTGTAEIPFTGWDMDGQEFTGKVSIIVEQAVAATIRYTTPSGVAAKFQQNDFNNMARALMNEDVVKVRFTPPNNGSGTLYYGYNSSDSYGGVINSATDCYTTKTPYLSQVAFVPASGFSGVVSIPYYAENANGFGFAGTVEVTVQPGAAGQFSDMAGFAWAQTAVDYLFQNGIVNGTSNNQYSPKGPTSRGDFALMIVRAFKFANTSGQGFSDVPTDSYYAQAITTARALGIVQGDGNSFRPSYPVSRQEAMVMLQRAMRVAGKTVNDGSASDLASFRDSGSVAGYAVGAVGAMVRAGVVQGDNTGKLNPTAFITRAEMAVILYRALNI